MTNKATDAHLGQTKGLGAIVQSQLDKKGIKSPKLDPNKGYNPNGDKKTTVYQSPHSKESRSEWENRMDQKFQNKIKIGQFGKLR